MTTRIFAASIAVPLLLAACASSPPKSTSTEPSANAASTPNKRLVKSKDGSFSGEVIGTPAPDSKFAKLQIGMSMSEVQETLGRSPDRWHTYESGKRWIPFYFGNDARRMQALFKDEGCLILTDGNVWGGAGGDVIQIEADPSGACYQP
jgi:hypothetical protein